MLSSFTFSFARKLSTLVAISASVLAGCAAEDPAPEIEDGAKRALFVVSNVDTMEANGVARDTGVWLSEVTHPYWKLADAAGVAFDIDIASPDGGRAAIDAFSVRLNLDDFLASGGAVVDSGDPGNERFLSDEATRDLVEITEVERVDEGGNTVLVEQYAFTGTLPLSGVSAGDYDLVFYAGGNGAVFQFPFDERARSVAEAMYDAGKLVTAVCHGTSALLEPQASDGGYLVAGRRATGFSIAEEEQLGQRDLVPLLIEEELPLRGALYSKADPWQSHVVVDERIITGQNPPSAAGVGQAIVDYFAE